MANVNDVPLLDFLSGSDCIISRARTRDFEKLCAIGNLGLVPGENPSTC
jgi:hypothetical protein